MKKSSLYAERIYSEHPLAAWALDDDISYYNILADSGELTWNATNANQIQPTYNSSTPLPDYDTFLFTKTSASSTIELSFTLNSVSDFSSDRNTACVACYVYCDNTAESFRIGVSYDATELYEDFSFSSTGWHLISKTFDMPATSKTLTFFVKSSGPSSNFRINAFSIGQWSEQYNSYTTGYTDADASNFSPFVIKGPLSRYSVVPADSYGINNDTVGYYLVKNKVAYCRPSGIPLVFGSSQSLAISQAPDANPSLILPASGFLNESGKYLNYTLEFWMRAYNSSVDPIRIIGPVASTDGVYLEEGFISIYVGPYTKSYFLGKYNRPMLVHFVYSESYVTLMINGETVITMDIDINNITFPDNEYAGQSLDWIGVYGNDYIFPFEIDCISIFPYLLPSDYAKRHFIYGQGVDDSDIFSPLLSRGSVFIDHSFAEYAYNMVYPDMNKWRGAFSINMDTNSLSLKPAEYSLPEVIIKDGSTEIDESDWFAENRSINNQSTDLFPYLLMSPNSMNTEASIYFDNLMMIDSTVESIFGIFRSPLFAASAQIVMRFSNKNTKEFVDIELHNTTMNYVYQDNQGNRTTLATEAIVENSYFNAGINIHDFTQQHYFTIGNFFSNLGVVSLAIGGGESMFHGKVYGIHICDKFFYEKDLSQYFTDGKIEQQTGVSDLLKYIVNYSLLPVYKNVTMAFDIGSVGYWEDVIPLSMLGKYVSASGQIIYDLDMIQFNIDSPYRQGLDESQNKKFYYYSLISYLNLENKDYQNFQSLGYASYQDIEDDFNASALSLRYSTGFKSFITLQDFTEAGEKKYSDFTVTASADASRVITINAASASNTKYEIYDNHIIMIPKTIDFTEKYLGIHLEMQVRATIEKNMGVKSMTLSSFTFNDGTPTKIGTKYSYPIYPVAELSS